VLSSVKLHKIKSMKFIKATEKDIPLIQDLARRSWEVAYAEILKREQIEYMLKTMYSYEEISNQLQHPDYHYFLIFNEINNSFEGFLGYENGYEEYTTKLHRIYLIPESKGKGIGKMAVDFLKQKVSESDDKRIILNVNKHNNAKMFYESQGFKVYEEIIVDIGSGFVMDDYEMEFYIT
jgi:diamine N-acetyltransferase